MKYEYKDRIKWTYRHTLNVLSKTEITKYGYYIGLVKHTYRWWEKLGAMQMAVVKFDDNKCSSKVPLSEIKLSVEVV